MTHEKVQSKEDRAYKELLNTCLSLDLGQNEKKIGTLKLSVSQLSKSLHEQVESFKEKIAMVPLSIFIVLWADRALEDKSSSTQSLKVMSNLLEAKLLPVSSLKEFAQLDPSSVIEDIRCFSGWTLVEREKSISVYKAFSLWLSKETFSYVSKAKDLDRLASQKRQIPFEIYIDILSHLDLREQILAKMFYLGGSRALEEVLSVKIEDIVFSKKLISMSEEIFYPLHLFKDIKEHIQGRKKGYVFIGKEGERISHTTPFRALKKAVSDLKLSSEFTFKEFTRNV